MDRIKQSAAIIDYLCFWEVVVGFCPLATGNWQTGNNSTKKKLALAQTAVTKANQLK